MTDNLHSKGKILIVDDEFTPRESLRLVLKDRYDVATASDALEGFDYITRNGVDLVVLDIKMPGINGIDALIEIKSKYPDTEIILLTAYASLDTAKSAVRFGAFDYLTKPFDISDVLSVVEKGLQKTRNNRNIQKEREKLWDRTKHLEEQIETARQSIILSSEGTVKALILTIDAKDHYTFNHSEAVADLASQIAGCLGMSIEEQNRLSQAARMHDIGKIGVDEIILRKNGPLGAEEFEEIKKHPVIGARIVQQVPFLEHAVPVILYHHEKIDGTGYPDGLKGDKIPLTARIVMIADAIDSMMHARPYRHALPMEKVLQELKDYSGTQFDPSIVQVILKSDILKVKR